MQPEELLHRFAPYLPTDRFRALLRNRDLPLATEGAALLTDVVGFTPLTTRLVSEMGAERAVDELKRRMNPMFEAVAGQVFHNGGSVIRFTGDGFIAWFDEAPIGQDVDPAKRVPAALRALSAGLEMQAVIPLFRGPQMKIAVSVGRAYRWVVGQPQHGLTDILSGPAVEAMSSLGTEAQPGEVIVHPDAIRWLKENNIEFTTSDSGSAIVKKIPDALSQAARQHRWPAWFVEGDVDVVLNTVRPFVGSVVRERVESGFGDFVAELRYALPLFLRFTSIDPKLDEARAALDSYIGTVEGVLANAGGRLVSVEVGEKGSIAFAVFGAPITYGDDAERAIRAALILRDVSTGSISTQQIGVSRGLLYAGTIGGEARHEYSTIGDETNIAARLMSVAQPGQILVSSDVRSEVSSRLVFQDLKPITIKGKDEPISVAEPVGIQSGTQHRTHVGQLIGRDNELSRLLQLMESAKSGLPRIARIEGEAGIGKSRLVAEMAQVAAEQGFRVTSGYCLSTGRTLTYLPWQSIVTSLIGLNIDGNEPESIAWLSGFVEKIDPEWLARLPLLGEVLDLPIPDTSMTGTLDGLTRRQATFALVTDLVLHLARKQPTLVILEDAHWIDEVSEALAVDLARRLSLDPAPVLFVLVHRDLSEVDHPPTLIRAIDALLLHTRVVVGELSRDDMSQMVETYLHSRIPPELSRFIFERAHGNPFFVQEVVDTLVETGYVRHLGNLTVIEKELENANLPQTVQGLVLARVDRLNEMDKLVLKVASVIGREFQWRVVSNSLPVKMEADELRSRLQTLAEREFTRLESGEPESIYRFKHAIIQEVTYASLLPAQRRQLHQAVAAAIEAIEPDAIEQLAYHFNRSGAGERARHYSILAGQKAFREYANQAALSYFTQAMAQANSDQDRFDINRQRLLVMARLGDTKLMSSELPVMQEQATRSNRVDWQAIIYVLQATYFAQTSAWPRVIDAAQRAAALARQIGNDTLAWDAYQLLYNAFVGINQPEEAEGVCRIMQPITESLGEPRRSIQLALMEIDGLYNQEAVQTIQLGGEDQSSTRQQEMNNALRLAAMHGAQDALEQARELDDPVLEAASLGALTRFHIRRNDLPSARETANQQLALFRQIGDRRLEGLTLNQIGSILVNLGQISDANAHLLDGYKILRQIGERAGEAISFVNLGLIASHYKAYDEALAYLQRGLAVQRELNAEADTAQTLFHMGNVYIVQEQYDEAIRVLDEARALFLASNLPQQMDEIYTALAEIHVRRGDLAAARAHIGPMLVRLRARGADDLFLPGLAYWRCIQVLAKCGETEAVAQLRATFRQQTEAIRTRLPDDQWRKNFVENLWYHAALLKD